MPAKIERDVHGVPLWLLREYLVDLGAEAVGDEQVQGDGWTAHITPIEPYRIGSLSVGRVRLTIEGDETMLESLLPRLELKLMRGGG